MDRIGLRELGQNPRRVAEGLKEGQSYTLTEYNREIGVISPVGTNPVIAPPKKRGGARTSLIPRRELRSAASVDELLDDAKGAW